MFSGCIIKVNFIDWNRNIDSRHNEKIDIAPLHSYFHSYFLRRYTLLSESIISKEEIDNYQLRRDFDRTENAESAISKILDL